MHAYGMAAYERHAYEMAAYERCPYERHAYEMAGGRDTPMRDTPIYIGWRKGVAFVAGGGVEYGSAGLSRSTRRCTYAGKRRCLRHYRRLGRAPARHTFPGNQPTV